MFILQNWITMGFKWKREWFLVLSLYPYFSLSLSLFLSLSLSLPLSIYLSPSLCLSLFLSLSLICRSDNMCWKTNQISKEKVLKSLQAYFNHFFFYKDKMVLPILPWQQLQKSGIICFVCIGSRFAQQSWDFASSNESSNCSRKVSFS